MPQSHLFKESRYGEGHAVGFSANFLERDRHAHLQGEEEEEDEWSLVETPPQSSP